MSIFYLRCFLFIKIATRKFVSFHRISYLFMIASIYLLNMQPLKAWSKCPPPPNIDTDEHFTAGCKEHKQIIIQSYRGHLHITHLGKWSLLLSNGKWGSNMAYIWWVVRVARSTRGRVGVVMSKYHKGGRVQSGPKSNQVIFEQPTVLALMQ